MAKVRMKCPFSGRLCEECPLYRGRHYFMCYCDKYRGHLNETGMADRTAKRGLGSARPFEIPLIKIKSAIDPYAIIMKEMEEGGPI